MKLKKTKLPGVYIIEPERLSDERGFFARIWCNKELGASGLKTKFVQTNLGFNKKKGTLRGLHFQRPPYQEVKVLRCSRGAMYDVVVDLRPESPRYMQWIGVELTSTNQHILYVPEGCAQGYLTLTDDTEMYYNTTQFYAPGFDWGVRYNDPQFGIELPIEPITISEKDKNWPDFEIKYLNIRKLNNAS